MTAWPLPRVPSGSDVFLDANVIVYALLGRSAECHQLLTRCATEDLFGVTSLSVVIETTHRLMLAEAYAAGLITKETAVELKKRAAHITQLKSYWAQIEGLMSMNILVLGLDEKLLATAQKERAKFGLMTNDSLIVATMRDHGLTTLISNDNHFDHVAGLIRYKPSDLHD